MNSENLEVYFLTNSNGTRLGILNFGASIFSLFMKDKNGDEVNVIVGPKDKNEYISKAYTDENKCFGASIGRYAGRISEGKFFLDGNLYKLYEKDGVHLHGGFRGIHHKIWKVESIDLGKNPSIVLSCVSEDGEEGYPGNLTIQVTYTLTEENEVVIQYEAETDKRTPVNLTNHAYYNLNGKGSVSNHDLFIASEAILEVDEKLRPTGKFQLLKEDEKDFSAVKKINSILLDDTFIFKTGVKDEVVRLYSTETGIELKIFTNQAAAVVFVPPHLSQAWEYQTEIGDSFPSLCVETQNFPDAPNHDNFPNSILAPNERYRNKSIFQFNLR
ncbi:galactose mutarotase [Gillisia sp. M10.2A]|uniref:Aldose 1-epimerase n=1 Tax=Gillisia lutea TaxID=2909668 RepID=A0ABS9EK62_9FLAO|nr:aldose epimerase family protein [Gillisia lutea]MCF4102549.1 galactose mutarotase [Gillisia lutea]